MFIALTIAKTADTKITPNILVTPRRAASPEM
jgi:hypothetical protein